MRIQRILVGLDGSVLSEAVLPPVQTLAAGLGAEVILFHAVAMFDRENAGESGLRENELLQQSEIAAEEYIHRIERELFGTAGIAVRSIVVPGDAAREIIAYAEREGVDLIALATHEPSLFGNLFTSTTSDEVLHAGHTPLLLIHPDGDAPGMLPAAALSQIIVPLDGDPLAESALPLAETLAERLHLPLLLVEAVDTIALGGDPMLGDVPQPDLFDTLEDAAQTYLERVAEGLRGRGLSVAVAASLGAARSTILDCIRREPGSMVVMATHARSGLAGAIFGSVARSVADESGVPTILVGPTPERASARDRAAA